MTDETALEYEARKRERAAVVRYLKLSSELYLNIVKASAMAGAAQAIESGDHWPPPVAADELPNGAGVPQD